MQPKPLSLGTYGENTAAEWLAGRGYAVVARNWRCIYGEIDIIAADATYIAFVEVKTRRDQRNGPAGASVTPSKQRKLRNTAAMYLAGYSGELSPRFDVIEVYARPGGEAYRINHIVNAFYTTIH